MRVKELRQEIGVTQKKLAEKEAKKRSLEAKLAAKNAKKGK